MSATATRSAAAETSAAASKSDLNALRADVETLQADIKALLGNASKYAKNESAKQLEKGKDLADQAQSGATDLISDAEAQIRQRPLAAIGIAFGVGALIATLRRK